jgi:hypothetical protein
VLSTDQAAGCLPTEPHAWYSSAPKGHSFRQKQAPLLPTHDMATKGVCVIVTSKASKCQWLLHSAARQGLLLSTLLHPSSKGSTAR